MWNARTGRQAGIFVKHVVPAVLKPARTLWNEVIGFVFLCIAVPLGIQTVRSGMHHEVVKTIMAGFCTLLLGAYGVGSFRRARKISRS